MRPHWVDRPGSVVFQLAVVFGLTVALGSWGCRVLTEARRATAEQLAVVTLRQFGQALELYRMAQQEYPQELTALGPPASVPPYVTPELIGDGTTARKQGYAFVYRRTNPQSYTLRAHPLQEGVTGVQHFLATETIGQIYTTIESRDATTADPLYP